MQLYLISSLADGVQFFVYMCSADGGFIQATPGSKQHVTLHLQNPPRSANVKDLVPIDVVAEFTGRFMWEQVEQPAALPKFVTENNFTARLKRRGVNVTNNCTWHQVTAPEDVFQTFLRDLDTLITRYEGISYVPQRFNPKIFDRP